MENGIVLPLMCLILFAIRAHPGYKLILAANRDEYYKRPTEPANWWPDSPSLLAGKDLQAGGTWLGLDKSGKIAAVTNYRSKEQQLKNALSRGLLVSNYLSGHIPQDQFFNQLPQDAEKYNGYNLLFGDIDRLYYFSNRQPGAGGIHLLQPGIYGISNALLDTPWPKISKAKKELEQLITGNNRVSPETLFALMHDQEIPADAELPDTGYGIELERILGPLFIETQGYGTRSTTVVLVDNNNRLTFIERSFIPPAEKRFQFTIA